MADDRLVLGFRFASMLAIMDATDLFVFFAMLRNASINSGSSDMLVWCPDKDTDIFFIFKTFHQLNIQILRDVGHRIFVICSDRYCPSLRNYPTNQM